MSKQSNYNPEAMEAALQEMKSDGTSLRPVTKKYGVPRSSLQFKIKNPGHMWFITCALK
jgi:lambda repressor-like predicted transcriptional regulator